MTPEPPTAGREVLPGALHLFGFPKVAAQVTVVRRSPADRMRRALLGLGTFWGIAILCVFIPIAHFVLVPSFLIIGIVVGVRRVRALRRRALVRDGRRATAGSDRVVPRVSQSARAQGRRHRTRLSARRSRS